MPEETQPQTPVAQQQQQEQQPAAPSDATKNTEQQPQEQTVPYARFKEINDKLKALEQAASEQAKAQAEADEKRLQEQQAWQQLAEKRKTSLDELQPKAELADKLTAMVATQYEATIKEWPEQVRAMAPGDEASILDKLAWMEKATPLARELMADKPPVAGNGRKPTPVGQAHQQQNAERVRATHERWARGQF